MVVIFWAPAHRFSVLALLALVLIPAVSAPAASAPPTPPSPPAPKPYTELFRKLLAASEVEQERLLSNKPPEICVTLHTKVREYRSIPAMEAERRLLALDLRWYLSSLIPLSPSNRTERLALMPARDRLLVEERLHVWESLPPLKQKEVLENEAAMAFLAGGGLGGGGMALRNEVFTRKPEMDEAIERWRAIPVRKRVQVVNDLDEILMPGRPLSEWERQKVREALPALAKLPPEQRPSFVAGLKKYLELGERQRAEFLRSAARWQQMSSEERQVLSDLIPRLPPSPPGLPQTGVPPLPPLTPPPIPSVSSSIPTDYATNRTGPE